MEAKANKEFENNAQELKKIKSEIYEIEKAEYISSLISEITNRMKEKERNNKEIEDIDALYDSKKTSFDYARNFLTRLGKLDLLFGNAQLSLLDQNNPEFMTLIKLLDKSCLLRKSYKVGVIYVKKGQTDQRSILWNNKGSLMYENFLSELGTFVSEDKAYEVFNTPANILYYATATYDIIFHVSTLMKTNVNDAQQIAKKKYIGNDSVHIVWSDCKKEYKPETIKSSFNFVHIVVYPMHNGLCRVKIKKKKEKRGPLVGLFGPLVSGMVISVNMLIPLLRYSAINGRKKILFKNLRVINPINERRETIGKIITRYSTTFKSKGEEESAIFKKLMNLNKS